MWLFGSRTSAPGSESGEIVKSPIPFSTTKPSGKLDNSESDSGATEPVASDSTTAATLFESKIEENQNSSSLLNLATTAMDSVADGPEFTKIREVLSVDVETEKYRETLRDIIKDPDFLRKKVPNVANMNDIEFGKTRDLVCVVLSHLGGRIVTANGFCKTGRTNYVTSWRGKCQASGTAGSTSTPVKRRKTVKCHCNFSFHLNRQGQVFLKSEHTCPEGNPSTLSASNKLLDYTLSSSEKVNLLLSCIHMLEDNSDLKRRDIERYVDGQLRHMGILAHDVSSGSFARVLYTQARLRADLTLSLRRPVSVHAQSDSLADPAPFAVKFDHNGEHGQQVERPPKRKRVGKKSVKSSTEAAAAAAANDLSSSSSSSTVSSNGVIATSSLSSDTATSSATESSALDSDTDRAKTSATDQATTTTTKDNSSLPASTPAEKALTATEKKRARAAAKKATDTSAEDTQAPANTSSSSSTMVAATDSADKADTAAEVGSKVKKLSATTAARDNSKTISTAKSKGHTSGDASKTSSAASGAAAGAAGGAGAEPILSSEAEEGSATHKKKRSRTKVTAKPDEEETVTPAAAPASVGAGGKRAVRATGKKLATNTTGTKKTAGSEADTKGVDTATSGSNRAGTAASTESTATEEETRVPLKKRKVEKL